MRRTKRIMDEITSLIDAYHTQLKDKTAWRYVGNYIEITTPYLNHNNDYIQIYIKKIEDEYIFSDGGSTISDPNLMYDYPDMFSTADGPHMLTTATAENFADRMNSFIHALLFVGIIRKLTSSQ
jgi:hypothetical protein